MDFGSEFRAPVRAHDSCALGPAADEAAFTIIEPLRRLAPVILASPHSGRIYPHGLLAHTRLPLLSLRRGEDAYVDELFAPAASFGATVLCANVARAYVDLNRDADELDPGMFADGPRLGARHGSPRVHAGLGVIPRIAGDGQDIYRGKLPVGEAAQRLGRVYRPYHGALEALIRDLRAQFGVAILVDCHSMPSSARGPLAPDVVLGDRFGASCHPSITAMVEERLHRLGYRVARNAPFAGGHTTQRHGQPLAGVHALQIELNRSLYMDERTLRRNPSFERVRADMARLAAMLTQLDLTRL